MPHTARTKTIRCASLILSQSCGSRTIPVRVLVHGQGEVAEAVSCGTRSTQIRHHSLLSIAVECAGRHPCVASSLRRKSGERIFSGDHLAMRLVTVQGSRRWRHRLILRDGRQLQGKNSENKHNGLNCGSHICHPDLKTIARKQPPCCPAFSVFGSCVPVRSVQSLRPLDLAHMHNRLEGGFRFCRKNGLNLHRINPQNRIPCAFDKSGPDFPNPTNERRATQQNSSELAVGRKNTAKDLAAANSTKVPKHPKFH